MAVETFIQTYGSVVALTFTSLNGLANGAYAGCAVVDNSALGTPGEDALVGVTIKANAAGVSATGTCTVYAYSDVDGTPNYTDGVTGTDAAQTPTSPPNLKFLGQINVVANSGNYPCGRWSVAKAFGGTLPKKWGIVVLNSSGAALNASGNSANYMPVNGQTTP